MSEAGAGAEEDEEDEEEEETSTGGGCNGAKKTSMKGVARSFIPCT